MKQNIILVFAILVAISMGCQQKTHQHQSNEPEEQGLAPTGTYGDGFSGEDSLPASEMTGLFTECDTVEVVLSGHIKASCKHTGCWMDLELDEKQTIHVTFEDEAFTIPLDAAGKNAVVQGIAFREMIPVETLRNYAREEGKSAEEIAAITEPAWEYGFVASGVIIEE